MTWITPSASPATIAPPMLPMPLARIPAGGGPGDNRAPVAPVAAAPADDRTGDRVRLAHPRLDEKYGAASVPARPASAAPRATTTKLTRSVLTPRIADVSVS